MPSLSFVLKAVASLTLASALMAIFLSIARAFLPEMAGVDILIATFTDGFKMGFVGLLGLLGGRSLTS